MFKVVGFVTMKTSILILWAFRINIVRDHGKKGGQVPFFSGDRGKKGPVPFFLVVEDLPTKRVLFSICRKGGVGVCQVPYGSDRANVEAATDSVSVQMCPWECG